MNADQPARHLRGCSCVAVPFAGGMCEVPHFMANVILVNDLDRHVINLGRVVRTNRRELQEAADAKLFHPDELAEAHAYCRAVETFGVSYVRSEFDWAVNYFCASWMTRGGKGGTDGEFEAGLSIRWKSGGGDSVVRFRNATEGLADWERTMRRCTFTTLDAFDFLAECRERDIQENGIYCDPPWPEDGDKYAHKFGESQHAKLRDVLEAFDNSRIVVRYGDHPLIRALYAESRWTWHMLNGRTQANNQKREVLLVRVE